MKKLSLTVVLSLALICASFQIKNIKHQLPIENAAQYVQYIQALNGMATQEDLANNPLLADIVAGERISLLNSVSDIVLVLLDEVAQNNENLPSVEELARLAEIDDILEGFKMINMAECNTQTVARKVEQLKGQGKTIHSLEVSEQLSQLLSNHSQRRLVQSHGQQAASRSDVSTQLVNEPTQNQQSARVTQRNTTNPTYILKFFFGFMFIIVSLGSLMAIANMQNRKDTLLYAKFIADVGAR